jgi:hypothetical protein
MNTIIEQAVKQFKLLSPISQRMALSNIQAIVATEQSIREQYRLPLDKEPPKGAA